MTLAEKLSTYDEKYWDFSEYRNDAPLVRYPAVMVAPMQACILKEIINADPTTSTVLDPFCGSGTVLCEGQKLGLNVMGFDINPMAVLIATVQLEGIPEDCAVRSINAINPRGLLQLKDRLESELNSRIGSPVRIDILADVLELADERWRGAVEGYLNAQKFYLLVDPAYYKSTLLIFDRIKKEFGFASFGLVDIGKLRERETIRPRDDSLARKVDTDNKLARSYIDYLLGRVVCCEKAEQLRNFKTAITVDGLLYQGYVVRSIRRELMDDAFVGRYAVSLRVSRLEEELTQIEDQLRYWNPIRQLLSQSKEPLFTHFFVQNTVAEKQKAYLHGMEIANEVTDIDDQLSKLDLLWLDEQRRTIAALGDEIIVLNKEKEQKGIQIGQHKERIRQLDYEVLPDHYQQLSDMDDRLQDDFPVEYQESIGLPRYQQELARLKRADIVHKNFSSRLEQSVKEQDTAQRKLFNARREYTDRFKPCSFRVEAVDNDEFEAEQKLMEESELPKYREKIKAARESAMEQFQNDFKDRRGREKRRRS